MARRPLHSAFMANARRLGRIQQAFLKLAESPPATRPKRKKRPARSALRQAGVGPRADDGAGEWHNFLYSLPTQTGLGKSLSYAVYLPAGVPAAGLPVVLMLHGCRQDMRDIARGSRMNMLADAKGFAVVYAQQSRRHNPNQCWRWFSPAGDDDADALAGILESVLERYQLDAGRVYAAGLSAGAGMAALLALRHPGLVTAIALHSGTVVGAASSARSGLGVMRHGVATPAPQALLEPFIADPAAPRKLPTIIVHGLHDAVVSARNAAQLATQFLWWNRLDASSGISTTLAAGTRNEYRRIDYGNGRMTLVRVCLVKELGHAWSGGNPELPFHAANGPDASALIWRFFSRHSKS